MKWLFKFVLLVVVWTGPAFAAPKIRYIMPDHIPAGSPNLTITVFGGGLTGHNILWDGNVLAGTTINDTIITFVAPASFLNAIGTHGLTTDSPISNQVPFRVLTPLAQVNSYTPTVFTGGQDTPVTVYGGLFPTDATILFDFQGIATTFVSDTVLEGTVPGGMIASNVPHHIAVYAGAFPGGSVTYVQPAQINGGIVALSAPTNPLLGGFVVRDTVGTITLGTPWFTITGTDASSFIMNSTGCANALTLAPSTGCSFNIQFSPTTAGTKNATLTVLSNALNGPQTMALTGTAVTTKTIATDLSALNFGSAATGSTTSALSFNVFASVGSFTLSTPYKTLGGTNPGDFTVTGASTCTDGGTVPCSVAVTFTPGSTGNRSATLTLNSGADNVVVVTLSGSGTTVATHHVLLNWTASSSANIVGYNIYRALPNGSFGSPLNGGTPVNAVTYTDTTTVAGTTYIYGITAVGGPPSWLTGTESVVAQTGPVTP